MRREFSPIHRAPMRPVIARIDSRDILSCGHAVLNLKKGKKKFRRCPECMVAKEEGA